MQLIYSITIPFLLGLGIALLISKKNTLLNLALSYPIGLGILGFIMFVLGIVRIPLNVINISIVAWLVIVLLFIFSLRKPETKRLGFQFPSWKPRSLPAGAKRAKEGLFAGFLILLISLKVIYIFFEAMLKPVFTWDAWARYALVAKAIFIDQSFLTKFVIERIEDYPLLIPLNQAFIQMVKGSTNDVAIKIISRMLLLSLLGILYYGLRSSLNKTKSLFIVFLLTTLPLIVFHSITAYLDLPLTVFYAAGTIFMFLFIKQKDQKDLIICAILLGLAVWTKRAGLYLAAINTTILFGYLLMEYKEKLMDEIGPFLNFSIILAAISLPWIIYSKIVAPAHYYTVQAVAENFSGDFFTRTPIVISIFLDKMFHSANWQLSFALLVLVLVFFFKKIKKEKIFLLAIILANLLTLIFIFQFTDAHKSLLDGTLLNRVMMPMMPIVLFFCGLVVFEE